jgi:hypothetical protein
LRREPDARGPARSMALLFRTRQRGDDLKHSSPPARASFTARA